MARRRRQELERVEVRTRAEWRAWLAANHTQADSIWLASYKKVSPHYLPYADIVEEALCFGWIDSQAATLDAERSMLLMARRKPGSGWSRPNKERIERLEAAGAMTPAGRAVVEAAKADGSWTMLDAVEALEVPGDLAAALEAAPPAATNFEAFPRSVKRAALEWIRQAKRPETRAKRITKTARLSQRNERPSP